MNNTIQNIELIQFAEHGDERGRLVVIEGGIGIPFDIKRIFYIYGSGPNDIRGQHANRDSAFCMINVCGSCRVKAIDTTGAEKVFSLNQPNIGLYLPAMIWKDMYGFSPDSVLLILSNEHYNENEYIRDFDAFLKGTNK